MTRRARHTGAALLALLAVVAVASTGSSTAHASGSRRPSDWAIDLLASLAIVLLVPGAVLLVLLLLLRPVAVVRPSTSEGARRKGRIRAAVMLVVTLASLVLAVRRLADRDIRGLGLPAGGSGGAGMPPPGRGDVYEPSFALVPVFVALILLVVAAVAVVLTMRSRRRTASEQPGSLSAAVDDVLAEALDDLRAEQDPRRAVIAAYARLERALAAHGLPRRLSETPEELLERVVPLLDVSRQAACRLTALFETAKFSQHEVGTAMKDEAIGALETTRDELRLASHRSVT